MQTYTIKPLEWRVAGGQSVQTDTPVGTYRIFKLDGGWWSGTWPSNNFRTLDAAKVSAEAHYISHIMPALSPTPPPRTEKEE